jgi:hypothetical protein
VERLISPVKLTSSVRTKVELRYVDAAGSTLPPASRCG